MMIMKVKIILRSQAESSYVKVKCIIMFCWKTKKLFLIVHCLSNQFRKGIQMKITAFRITWKRQLVAVYNSTYFRKFKHSHLHKKYFIFCPFIFPFQFWVFSWHALQIISLPEDMPPLPNTQIFIFSHQWLYIKEWVVEGRILFDS